MARHHVILFLLSGTYNNLRNSVVLISQSTL